MNDVLSPEDIARKAIGNPTQKRITALQGYFKELPQVDCPLTHEFKGGFYMRTIHVPSGTVVISKIFKQDFPFYISKGAVSVWVEDGGVKHLQAPFWGHTVAGSRRIIVHHTDVDWTTIHWVGDLRDLDQIEKQVIYSPDNDKVIEITPEIVKELSV
jgi:hypothetical protein